MRYIRVILRYIWRDI